MGQRVFLVKDRIQLIGDERDFVVPVKSRREVLSWCKKMGIQVEQPLNKDNRHIANHYFDVDLWRVKDDTQRLWFQIKWA